MIISPSSWVFSDTQTDNTVTSLYDNLPQQLSVWHTDRQHSDKFIWYSPPAAECLTHRQTTQWQVYMIISPSSWLSDMQTDNAVASLYDTLPQQLIVWHTDRQRSGKFIWSSPPAADCLTHRQTTQWQVYMILSPSSWVFDTQTDNAVTSLYDNLPQQLIVWHADRQHSGKFIW